MRLKVLTLNIHKGFNWRNTQLTLHALKNNLQILHPDIVFLQEVVGENKKYEKKFDDWITNQFEFLAKDLWDDFAYSHHAVFDHKHHGNVILSKFPILSSHVEDLTINNYEKRAILFSKISIEDKTIHAFCTHLNLTNRDRLKQYEILKKFILANIDNHHPTLLCGDFNDWNKRASTNLLDIENLKEVHKTLHGDYGRTFPMMFPMLSLDRIYSKGLIPIKAEVLNSKEWQIISDHLPLYCELDL